MGLARDVGTGQSSGPAAVSGCRQSACDLSGTGSTSDHQPSPPGPLTRCRPECYFRPRKCGSRSSGQLSVELPGSQQLSSNSWIPAVGPGWLTGRMGSLWCTSRPNATAHPARIAKSGVFGGQVAGAGGGGYTCVDICVELSRAPLGDAAQP